MNVSDILAHHREHQLPWSWLCDQLLAREAEMHQTVNELKAALYREQCQRESTERALTAEQNKARTAKQETQNLRMSLSYQCIEDLRAKLAAAEREAKSSKEAETRESSRAYQLEQENAQLRATDGREGGADVLPWTKDAFGFTWQDSPKVATADAPEGHNGREGRADALRWAQEAFHVTWRDRPKAATADAPEKKPKAPLERWMDLPAFNQGRAPLTIKVKDLKLDQWIWHDKEHPSRVSVLVVSQPGTVRAVRSRCGNVLFDWKAREVADGYLLTLERTWKL